MTCSPAACLVRSITITHPPYLTCSIYVSVSSPARKAIWDRRQMHRQSQAGAGRTHDDKATLNARPVIWTTPVGGRARTLQAKVILVVVMAGGQHKSQKADKLASKDWRKESRGKHERRIQGRDLPQVVMIPLLPAGINLACSLFGCSFGASRWCEVPPGSNPGLSRFAVVHPSLQRPVSCGLASGNCRA